MKYRLNGHIGSVYALAPGLLSGEFYSGAGDRIVASWKEQSQDDGHLVIRAADAVYALLPIPEHNKLWVGQGLGGIHVIDIREKEELRLLQPHNSVIFDLKYHTASGDVFGAGADGLLSIINAGTFDIHSRIRISAKKVRCIAFHPNEQLIVAGCGEGDIAFIDLHNYKPSGRLRAHQPDHSVNILQFSPDGHYLLSGSRDAHLNIYDANSFKLLESIPAHNYALYALAWSPDGKYFATASRDKTVKIWNTATFSVIQRLEGNDGKGHVNSVNCLLWTKSNLLFSAGDDRAIACWEMIVDQE